MEWHKEELNKEQVRAKAKEYNLDLLTASILARRGLLAGSELLFYLESKAIFMHNPFLLDEMDEAASRLVEAIQEDEQLFIMGDRDADGITGTALLTLYLKKRGLKPVVRVPLGDEPYGLQNNHIDEAKAAGATLIVCIDNGVSCAEQIKLAQSNAIDVIIFDHHEDKGEPLPAFAYVNPKRTGSNYPNPSLSASSVVHKALMAMGFIEAGLFRQVVCLINVSEDKQKNHLIIDVVRSFNMQAEKPLRFTIDSHEQKEKFIRYIEGAPLYMYQKAAQCALLESYFGADVYAEDLAELLKKRLGPLSQLPLSQLMAKSSLFKYSDNNSREGGELQALHALYLMAVYENSSFNDYFAGFDLAAIGLVADVMPVHNENRIIVKQALDLLNSPQRDSVRELLNELDLLNGDVGYHNIGWRLAPLLNAAGRMGVADKALNYLLSESYGEREQLLKQMLALNNQRRKLSDEWWQKLVDEAYRSERDYEGKLICLYNEALPRGLSGLIASRLARLFPKTLVVVMSGSDNIITGSLRSERTDLIEQFFAEFSPLFLSYGGHSKAGGFSLVKDDKAKLMAGFKNLIKNFKEEPLKRLNIDAELTAEHFDAEKLRVMLKRLAPYGEGFNKVHFVTHKVAVKAIEVIGKTGEHLKLNLALGEQTVLALWWGAAGYDINEGQLIDVVYTIKEQDNFCLEIVDVKQVS